MPSTAPSSSAPTAGIDRRAAVRHLPQSEKTSNVDVPRRGRPWKAMIRDLSTTGIGLVLNQTFDAGAQLAVELQIPDGLLIYTMLTRVAHSTRQPNGAYLVGCSFVRELSEEELQNLL
ncbi:MAG: PilZ domain-containing protein [Gemmataceae bacterium]|nr:PilZ domain-containing protein [Gemmataceae bacterium]